MKFILSLFALLLGTLMASAAMLTVSFDGLADYVTVQEAIDVASPGDTILVYPGGVYGGFNVTKRLIIMGGGIEPQVKKNTKIAGIVTLAPEADNTGRRSLWISGASSGGYYGPSYGVLRILNDCRTVLVWRCLIENTAPSYYDQVGVWVGDTASVRFLQCAFWYSAGTISGSYAISADRVTAITLENRVFARWQFILYSGVALAVSPLTVRHCLFDGWSGAYGFYTAASGSIENSVFIATQPIYSASNVTVNYNVSLSDAGTNFANYVQWNAQYSDYRLAGGSALIDAGNPSSPFDLDASQADQGVYGGQHPYVKNGAPDLLFVVELEVPMSAPADGTIPVFTRGRVGPGN